MGKVASGEKLCIKIVSFEAKYNRWEPHEWREVSNDTKIPDNKLSIDLTYQFSQEIQILAYIKNKLNLAKEFKMQNLTLMRCKFLYIKELK